MSFLSNISIARNHSYSISSLLMELDVQALNGGRSAQELLNMIKCFVPKLNYNLHKGQCGRIAVVGGCQEYTGAPYFAAITCLKSGADLSHVFCTTDSAPVIKSYSPELIVHPVLDKQTALDEIGKWLPKMHSVVIGPGLGRHENLLNTVGSLMEKVKSLQIPLVVDADGVFLLSQNPDIIRGYRKAILTPNVVEFHYLFQKVMGEEPRKEEQLTNAKNLSKALGNVTIVMKGPYDIITDGEKQLVCNHEGSPRRCGGQGDLLSGSMGTFNYWSHFALNQADGVSDNFLKNYGPTISAAYAACTLTRECNRLAFSKHGRSLTTSEMLTMIPHAFNSLYE